MVLIDIFVYLKSTGYYMINETITTLFLCMEYQIVSCSVVIEIREVLYPLCMSIYICKPTFFSSYLCFLCNSVKSW